MEPERRQAPTARQRAAARRRRKQQILRNRILFALVCLALLGLLCLLIRSGVRLIQNLVIISARKNLTLSRRILHTTPKTIRERLLAYLSYQELLTGSPKITIAFNRQQLADYLSVDRSALSKEIGKMQKDGLLEVKKNEFVLKSRE